MESDERLELGTIKIANEVVAIIAGLAATEVDGVVGMTGTLTSGITELLGKKNLTKGVKVEVGEKECACDLNIMVKFGVKLAEVCKKVQENVKNAIESMTGLTVVEVNVHVTDVIIEEPEKEVETTKPRVK